jgi:hypothetical protein
MGTVLAARLTPLLISRRSLQQTPEGLAMDLHATNFAPRIPRHHDASLYPAVSYFHAGSYIARASDLNRDSAQ